MHSLSPALGSQHSTLCFHETVGSGWVSWAGRILLKVMTWAGSLSQLPPAVQDLPTGWGCIQWAQPWQSQEQGCGKDPEIFLLLCAFLGARALCDVRANI